MKKFRNLIEVTTYFADKKVCEDELEKLRWKDGTIKCPHCQSTKKIYRTKRSFKCSECNKQFSVKKGTIFENSPISLQKWFVAIYIISSHKKGISSHQLGKDIGVRQATAWFMLQRIRFALENKSFNVKLSNVVEVDETYVGGKNSNRHANKKVKYSQGRSTKDKVAVFGMLERGGKVIAMKVNRTSSSELFPIINKHVDKDTHIMTDEWTAYKRLGKFYPHSIVNHGKGSYVIGDAHTNTIEGFWAILKRGIIGIYHHVSKKHIDKYIKEFEYRYNTRKMDEDERFNNVLSLCESRITYKQLTKKAS